SFECNTLVVSYRQKFRNTNSVSLQKSLHHVFIHADCRPKHPRSHTCNVKKLHHTLYSPVLTIRTVKYWKNNINITQSFAAFRLHKQCVTWLIKHHGNIFL